MCCVCVVCVCEYECKYVFVLCVFVCACVCACVCVCVRASVHACMYACMRVCAHHIVNMLGHLLWRYLWLLNTKDKYECATNLQFIPLPSQWYYCTLEVVQIILQRVRHDSKVCLFEKLSLSV